MSLLPIIGCMLIIAALILYYFFIIKPIEYEQRMATEAKHEAEEKSKDIERLLADALSEASAGSHQEYN